MNVGHSIKAIRQKKNVTQGKLADLIGLSQTALSQIENGNSDPSGKTMRAIASALETPEPMIYFLAMEESDVPENKKQLYQTIFPALRSMALSFVSE